MGRRCSQTSKLAGYCVEADAGVGFVLRKLSGECQSWQGATHRAGGLGYWAFIMLYAVRVGFSGALSTVSTFVAEVSSYNSGLPCLLPVTEGSDGSMTCNNMVMVSQQARVVLQISGQMKLVPEALHAYTYSIGSLAAGALLGVLVYGSMVWSA